MRYMIQDVDILTESLCHTISIMWVPHNGSITYKYRNIVSGFPLKRYSCVDFKIDDDDNVEYQY